MCSRSSYLTELVTMMCDQTGSEKFKLAISKSEILIACDIAELEITLHG